MCTSPIKAKIWRAKDTSGKYHEKVIFFKAQDYKENRTEDILIPCGKCIECLLSKKKRIKSRIMYEIKKNKYNYFITLTYKNNPKTLNYKDIQLFFKKIRRTINCEKMKYYVVGEYGEKTGRPHWHLILSGIKLEDTLKLYKLGTNGAYYNSNLISECWNYKGWAVIARATEPTAAYVANYCLKKTNNKVIGRASINYGIDTTSETLYRSDGTPLTRKEKLILRNKDEEKYFKLVDNYRRELKEIGKIKTEFDKKMFTKVSEKAYNKMYEKRNL